MPRTLDHLVLCVAGLDPARAGYRAMGFTLTPPATHPFGTRNSLAQLPGRNFLELLALDASGTIPPHDLPRQFSFGAHNADFLRRHGEGLSMLVFASDDAEADVAAFARSGLATYAPFHFGREAVLPDGRHVRVAFSLAFVTHPEMPDLAFFTCQQRHPPELFWKPDYQRHANGAERLEEVVMVAAQPSAFAGFFAHLTGGTVAVDQDGGALRVGAARDRISVLTPAAVRARFPELDIGAPAGFGEAPRFVGYRITVADLPAVRRLLDGNAVPYRPAANAVVVPPRAAHSVVVEFSAVPPPPPARSAPDRR